MTKIFDQIKLYIYKTKTMSKKDLIQFYQWETTYTKTGYVSGFRTRIEHTGLNEGKNLSAKYEDDLEDKINKQISSWDTKWNKLILAKSAQEKLDQAASETRKAKKQLEDIENILNFTLDIDDALDWNSLKKNIPFNEPQPKKNTQPEEPKKINKPRLRSKPKEENIIKPCPKFKLIMGGKKKWDDAQKALYDKELDKWKKSIERSNKKYEERLKAYEKECSIYKKRYSAWQDDEKRRLDDWQNRKTLHQSKQEIKHQEVDNLKSRYESKDSDAVKRYCELVLESSIYPDSFPKKFDLEYKKEIRHLLIDYQLPSLENIPNKTLVKYIKSRDEFEDKYLSNSQHEKLFDNAIYQIVLRTIHEIFESDIINAIDGVTLNGIVSGVSKATGRDETKIIVSISAKKDTFIDINLKSVDPKTCFKNLKGVGSAKLSGITPVAPLAKLNTSDRRFTDHYEVAGDLDESTNLASMHWEDFEHLVREIFEKEFGRDGGEVKVTQASADGGVDAVAFDPDPVKGGKIVIQAKRYTNTVGVSAVRDLYGTVMSEGANKGILVTTSDYGPDSYEWASGKPLTLLNGGNLLNLLEKYGHKAKIDIKEAKIQLEADK